jgi:hypothetical protein
MNKISYSWRGNEGLVLHLGVDWTDEAVRKEIVADAQIMACVTGQPVQVFKADGKTPLVKVTGDSQ